MTLIHPRQSGFQRYSRGLARCFWILKPDDSEFFATTWNEPVTAPVWFVKQNDAVTFLPGHVVQSKEERRSWGFEDGTFGISLRVADDGPITADDLARNNVVGTQVLSCVFDPFRPYAGYLYAAPYIVRFAVADGPLVDLDLVGLSGSRLQDKIGHRWRTSCDNEFGVGICDTGGTVSGNPRFGFSPASVTAVRNRQEFTVVMPRGTMAGDLSSYFDDVNDREVYWGGKIQFTSGPLAGSSFAIESHDEAVVEPSAITFPDLRLVQRPADRVGVGDAVTMRGGCDRKDSTCLARWQNRANFRGGNLIGGSEQLIVTPTAI